MAEEPASAGGTTATSGTPFAVDMARDRQARRMWGLLLGGPLLWMSHFMFVYLVAEAGCSGDGPGLDVFDPPVPRTVTLVATAVAAAACVPLAIRALHRWRQATGSPAGDGPEGIGSGAGHGTVAFAGFLLSVFSILAIVFVGLPAAFLPAC